MASVESFSRKEEGMSIFIAATRIEEGELVKVCPLVCKYERELKKLLAIVEQAVSAVDFENKSTPSAPLRCLKNAVDFYKTWW